MAERRVLCAEAERRARGGEGPVAIRATLGIASSSYARWAKLYGFRLADLYPSIPHIGAAVLHPPGPGGYARSGRFYDGRGLPEDHPAQITGPGHPGWTGGEAASRAKYEARRDGLRDTAQKQVEDLSSEDLLKAVRAALACEEISEADRLLRAWRTKRRREASLDALIREVEGEPEAEREIGASGQPMRTLAELDAMDDDVLRDYVRSLLPAGYDGPAI